TAIDAFQHPLAGEAILASVALAGTGIDGLRNGEPIDGNGADSHGDARQRRLVVRHGRPVRSTVLRLPDTTVGRAEVDAFSAGIGGERRDAPAGRAEG